MADESIVAKIDAALGDFLGSWDAFSTILALVVLVILVYPIFAGQEPDTHPFLLARQAQASPIRHPGESAVYRSTDLPYGYPLRTGLGVKDPGAPKWTSGRDGDVRDVWRQAVKGPLKDDGSSAGPRGSITTVLGTEQAFSHDLDVLTTNINTIGKYIEDAGGKKVAVCLSNSAELLCTVLAGAFYGFSPVLVPYGQNPSDILPLLAQSGADTLIAEAGSVPLENLVSKSSTFQRVIWVAKAGSKHLDWNEVPEGVGGKLDVSTWHDLVEEKKSSASREPLPFDKDSTPPPLATFWATKGGSYELVEYTSQNITSAIAGLIASLPRNYKLSSSDTVVSLLPLTETYALCWTLAALFSNASIALNSVAGEGVDLAAATRLVEPTIMIASSATAGKYHEKILPSTGGKFSNYFAKRALAAGTMPAKKPANLSSTPQFSKLRLLLVSQRDTAPRATFLPSSVLATLRLALGTRIGYALTTGNVAGAVCQSNILDYRDKGSKVVVGGPVSSVEVNVVAPEDELARELTVGGLAKGRIVVKGPAVVASSTGKGDASSTTGLAKIELETVGMIDIDHTVVLA